MGTRLRPPFAQRGSRASGYNVLQLTRGRARKNVCKQKRDRSRALLFGSEKVDGLCRAVDGVVLIATINKCGWGFIRGLTERSWVSCPCVHGNRFEKSPQVTYASA